MSFGARLGILGGTFDPVHVGHVETALAARDALALDRVLLLPSRVPPHRPLQPFGSPFHRFAMTAMAVNGIEPLEASDAELGVPGASYTADTLTRFHGLGVQASQIFFIIGADAFAEIETWHRYPDVLDLANFVVIARPGHDLARVTGALPRLAARIEATPFAPTAAGRTPRIYIVPAATPDVSSTDIRSRLGRGASIAGQVPEAVERHISQHGLYVRDRTSTPTHSAADHLHGQN
jgi:nicotinate-nucleotide adenylyltransferase